jgi:hypothetical protein
MMTLMIKFDLLRVSFDDGILFDTFDSSVAESIISELNAYYKTDRIRLEAIDNCHYAISARKKDKIRINKQIVLHFIGAEGWEPYSVHGDDCTYYFRKQMPSI